MGIKAAHAHAPLSRAHRPARRTLPLFTVMPAHLDVQDADEQRHNGEAIQLKAVALQGESEVGRGDDSWRGCMLGLHCRACFPCTPPCTLPSTRPKKPHQVGQGVDEGKAPVERGRLLVVQGSKHPGLGREQRFILFYTSFCYDGGAKL